jgi:hypothetical protein
VTTALAPGRRNAASVTGRELFSPAKHRAQEFGSQTGHLNDGLNHRFVHDKREMSEAPANAVEFSVDQALDLACRPDVLDQPVRALDEWLSKRWSMVEARM